MERRGVFVMIAMFCKRLMWAALLTFALIGAASIGFAQQKPSAASIKLAQEIVALKGSAAMVDPIVAGVIERIKFMHLQTNPMLSKPLDAVAAQLRKEYAQVTKDLQYDLAALYASRFTEADLKQILAFYKSPAGQKVIKEEPQILEVTMQQLKVWQERFGEEVLSRFRAEMKKRGHEL
jgi:hypothetical protein